VRQPVTAGPCARRRQSPADWDGVKVRRDILIGQWIPVGIVAGTVLTLQVAFPAYAAGDLNSVIDSIRAWVAGLLAGLATLFLTIGGVRYLAANGNPRAIEEGKAAIIGPGTRSKPGSPRLRSSRWAAGGAWTCSAAITASSPRPS
jgi:hypothetical protein